MIILGIDPGSNITGFGVVRVENGTSVLVDSGVIRASKVGTDHQLRLKQIYDSLCELIGIHLPDLCAVEMPIYGKNPQSMLKLGRAQATAMLAALNHQIPVTEYTPKEIKKAVTGNGNASKEQVCYMVETILSMQPGTMATLDASDALAVALCHIHRGSTMQKASYKNWGTFIRENPDRLREMALGVASRKVVRKSPFFVSKPHDFRRFFSFYRAMAHVEHEMGNLLIFVRGLVPFGMGLFDDRNQDPDVGIPFFRRWVPTYFLGEQICVASNLTVGHFRGGGHGLF